MSKLVENQSLDRRVVKGKGSNVVLLQSKSPAKMQCLAVVSATLRRRIARNNMDSQDVLSSRLEEEFACLSSSASTSVWYIDNRASAHMTGVQEYFSSYQEEQMDFHITMGNRMKV